MSEKKKYRLRNMDVTRVDLVDRGANQFADIVLAKADARPSDLADRIKQFMANKTSANGEESAKPEANPLQRPKGEKKQIVRIRPTDFEVTEMNQQMMEWAIPDDKLPEGVEEAIMTMAYSGDVPVFQWMIDPLAGPPQEGQAKTAAEAFMAMRAALSGQSAMDPAAMLGGFPSEKKPGGMNGGTGMPQQKPMGVAKRVKMAKRIAKHAAPTHPGTGTDQSVHGSGGGGGNGGGDSPKDEAPSGPRPLYEIAREIRRDWGSKVNFGAKPYLDAMGSLDKISDNYFYDSGESVVAYFLSNASTWRGDTARRVKAELKEMLKMKKRDDALNNTLELITKGLVEVNVFADTATGEDLRDILPDNLLSKIRNELSAESAE